MNNDYDDDGVSSSHKETAARNRSNKDWQSDRRSLYLQSKKKNRQTGRHRQAQTDGTNGQMTANN